MVMDWCSLYFTLPACNAVIPARHHWLPQPPPRGAPSQLGELAGEGEGEGGGHDSNVCFYREPLKVFLFMVKF